MPRNLTPPAEWWSAAADLMVRYDLSLREAAAELGIDLNIDQADAILRRRLFQKALEDAKIAHYTEIGSSPKLSKDLVVGQVYELSNKLAEHGEEYKATDSLLKLAKLKGWVGYEPDSLYKTLNALSDRDLNDLKKQIREQVQQQPASTEEPQEPKAESPKAVN